MGTGTKHRRSCVVLRRVMAGSVMPSSRTNTTSGGCTVSYVLSVRFLSVSLFFRWQRPSQGIDGCRMTRILVARSGREEVRIVRRASTRPVVTVVMSAVVISPANAICSGAQRLGRASSGQRVWLRHDRLAVGRMDEPSLNSRIRMVLEGFQREFGKMRGSACSGATWNIARNLPGRSRSRSRSQTGSSLSSKSSSPRGGPSCRRHRIFHKCAARGRRAQVIGRVATARSLVLLLLVQRAGRRCCRLHLSVLAAFFPPSPR